MFYPKHFVREFDLLNNTKFHFTLINSFDIDDDNFNFSRDSKL